MPVSGRRLLIRGVLLAVVAACASPALSQQAKVYRVGFFASVSPLSDLTGDSPRNPAASAFVDELRKQGFVAGRNLLLEMRTLEGRSERLEPLLNQLLRNKTDVIFFPGDSLTEPALKFTGNVPIVSLFGSDLVGRGLVNSFAHPGGNVTGLVVDVDAAVEAKRLEFLRELAPRVKRVAFFGTGRDWERFGRQLATAADRLGLELFPVALDPARFDEALAALERARPDAVYVPTGPTPYGKRREIGEFLLAKRLPSTCSQSELADHGCLMAYGVDIEQLMRQAAGYVAKVLQGAKPADLPIEGPKKFQFVLNMRAANAIGLDVPPSIRVRIDRVVP
jgi:ABC-type uncharacterized transport system substrate-binding protein